MAKIKQFSCTLSKIQTAAIDSSIFIYKFEQNQKFEDLTSVIFDRLSCDKLSLSTSVITVAEVLAKPIELNNWEAVYLYETVFSELPNFKITSIDYQISKLAAHLRARYKVLLADGLQIASAMQNNMEVFITNDKMLKKVKDMQILCLKDFI